jgi:hypothetical protein
MPCRDYESDSYSSPTDSWQYRDLKERADMLARIACKAMTELENNRIEDLLLLRDDEVREWWAKHKEADRKAREKEQRKQERIRLRRAALRKLSEEEKIALGLKKSKDQDIESDVTQDLLAVADKILKRKAKEEWQKNRGADFKYVPLIGNRKPALNYRD